MVEKNLYKMFSSIGNFLIKKNHCKTFIEKITIGHHKALEIVSQIFYIKY